MLSQRRQCSGAPIHAGNADRHDGHKNNDIHEAVVPDEACIERSKDERRGAVSIRIRGIQETVIRRADQEADEGETKNVEPGKVSMWKKRLICVILQGDAPENLFDGTGKGLARIGRLRRS